MTVNHTRNIPSLICDIVELTRHRPLLHLVRRIRRIRRHRFGLGQSSHNALTASTGVAVAFSKSRPSALAIKLQAVRVT
jgi:hypothetical protein